VKRLLTGFGIARIGYAVALIVAPRSVGRAWLGDAVDLSGGRVAARALVARDAFISVGLMVAASRDTPTRPWLAALIASDTADLVTTVSDSRDLPEKAAPGAIALAGSAALAGAALYCVADQ
jgi:hypothetical protein